MVSSSPPDCRPAQRRWFHHYSQLVQRTGGGHVIIATKLYVGPMVVNIIITGVQLAVMKAGYHRRLLPTGPKPSVKGGLELDFL
jgi:hypothetical protein